jgi:lipopolysaccharide/colanic/teichoic acid biosynthesis glycosyltransferase
MESTAIHPLRWPGYPWIKRIAEIILAAVLLILLWPLILVSMVAVWISSPGSPLYSQRRLGFRGRPIVIYKIRTMYADCERATGAVWSVPDDARVTTVGRFLRKTHLDELPQLFNVVRGDLSLIGPRPERPEIVAKLEPVVPHYSRRLEIRPGLTGLAQVLQPPDTDVGSVRRKLELDLLYIERGGPIMDLRILLLGTPLHIIDYPCHKIAQLMGVWVGNLEPSACLDDSDSGSEWFHIETSCTG